MPRRLVDVDVDAHHEVEVVERGGEALAVRRRDDRVAGDRDERADLPVAGRLDLLGHAGGGQLAEDLRRAAHPAAASARTARRGPSPIPRVAVRGQREHRAAGPVEVAGDRVEHVDEPARGRAEALRRRADPPVDRRALGGRELDRHPPDRLGRDAGRRRDRLGREVAREPLDDVGAGRRPRARVSSASANTTWTSAMSSSASVPGPDRHVLVGELGGARAPRVDDDDLAAAVAGSPAAGRARRARS